MSLNVLKFNYPEGMFGFCDLMRSSAPAWVGRGGSDTDFVELWDGKTYNHPSVVKCASSTATSIRLNPLTGLSSFVKMYLRSSSLMDLCTVHMSSRFGASLEGDSKARKVLEERYGLRTIMCWRFIENATYFMESFKLWGLGKKILVVSPFSTSIEYQTQPSKLPYLHKEDYGFGEAEFSTLNTPVTYNEKGWTSEKVEQTHWFETAESLFEQVRSREFDIAWLSCGSYAMYLGERIKRDLGKKAIYLGGLANVFFNIYNFRYSSTGHDLSVVNPRTQIESFENAIFNTPEKTSKFPFSEGLRAYFGERE